MTGICASSVFRQARLVAYRRQFLQDLQGAFRQDSCQNSPSRTLERYFWLPQSRQDIDLLFGQSQTALEPVLFLESYTKMSESEA